MHTTTRDDRTVAVTVIYCLVIAGLVGAARFFLPPTNLAPVGALCILVGARLRTRYAYLVPFAVMLITDGLLLAFRGNQPYFMSVYLCYALYVAIGRYVPVGRSWWSLSAVVPALLGTAQFFLITNFEAWWRWSDPNGIQAYQRTLSGLLTAYAAGLPFAWKTLVSDVGFTITFFGMLEVVLHIARSRDSAKEPVASAVQG